MRRLMLLLSAGMFVVGCFSLYLMLELQMPTRILSPSAELILSPDGGEDSPLHNNELNNIEVKIRLIEEDLKRNHQTISDIKSALHQIVKGDVKSIDRLKRTFDAMDDSVGGGGVDQQRQTKAAVEKVYLATRFVMPSDKRSRQSVGPIANNNANNNLSKPCLLTRSQSKADVNMLGVYKDLEFDNVDGGVWKQGWELTYKESQWNPKKKLKVFVVPHSHNDPGWLKTFEEYFKLQTVHIFNNMVVKLKEEPGRKFIWAEVSYLSMWWNQAKSEQRDSLRKLIESGQLEIVTGGWVMTDEANAHYYAMIDQLMLGHEWLQNHLNVKPKVGWAIDPFGHSPTMAYILKRSGIQNMLVQRIHYNVKKYLAKHKQLEFMWRQDWDSSSSTDMFCHMMPFYSYDVPHTCGPDPKICCQFDFRRLPGGKMNCPWKAPPQPITSVNVGARAKMILDQWRKKSQLYRSNVVLAPLGDDFRYDKATEWDQQFGNYKRLFDHMNAKADWHVEAKFGTLSDYFAAVADEFGVSQGQPLKDDFPTLSGDFFTYSDRDDHYWSGYYTSRPFYKRQDRLVESHVRGAEILFSLARSTAVKNKTTFPHWDQAFANLSYAREYLGLFQHHDGITGTAKDKVTVDYGVKLVTSLTKAKEVMVASSQYLIANSLGIDSPETIWFDVDAVHKNQDSLPRSTVIRLSADGSAKRLVLYNSLAHARQSVVRLKVSTPWVEVKDSSGSVVAAQVNLVWTSREESSSTEYELAFVASVAPLSLTSFTLRGLKSGSDTKSTSFCEVTLYNSAGTDAAMRGPIRISRPKAADVFSVENGFISVEFSGSTGLLRSVTLTETGQDGGKPTVTKVNVNLEFVKYGTTTKKDKSGAYLFMPDGPAKPLPVESPLIRVIKGRILTDVHVFLDKVFHVVRVKNVPGVDGMAVEMNNVVDIKSERNFEMAMRFHSDVNNAAGHFFTDLNGFQTIKRQYFAKLPLQANFYPMPTMAFIEDDRLRLSVLSGQSLGVAALQRGWIEIVLDRRLAQDDNRGLAQGVLDNKPTPNTFRILVERRITSSSSSSFPTLIAHQASLETIHPIFAFPQRSSSPSIPSGDKSAPQPLINVTSPQFRSISFLRPDALPCDVHLLNLRTMRAAPNHDADSTPRSGHKVALLLHRLGAECLHCSALTDGRVEVAKIFSEHSATDVQPVSLSGIHENEGEGGTIPPMEIYSYFINLR